MQELDEVQLLITAGTVWLVRVGIPRKGANLVTATSSSIGGTETTGVLAPQTAVLVTHGVLIQHLLYQEEWRRRFEKEMDFWFVMKPGDVWPNSAFEPLLVGISFPLSRVYPWLVRQQRDQVVEAGSLLSKMSKESHVQVGDYLRKLWVSQRPFPSV